MPSRKRCCAHAAPTVAGSLRPRQLRCGSECYPGPCYFFRAQSTPSRGVGAGCWSSRNDPFPTRQTVRPPCSSPVAPLRNSLFCRKNSLFRQMESLFLEEQGIGHKLLNPRGDWLPKRPKVAGIVRNF